jgi:uncharacterized protein
MNNAISWFEIPATDLARATKFYETIFSTTLIAMDMPNIRMRLIYLNANPDVQNILSKVDAAGGKIVVPKTEISDAFGFMAIIIDTEGNRIGLHSI